MDSGSIADWVSGVGSLLAVVAALVGYWIVHRQYVRDQRDKEQGAAYQICFKLTTLIGEASGSHDTLFQPFKTEAEWLALSDPIEICATQQAMVGFDETAARDLSESEQNLLLKLKEENFLMDYSEGLARHHSIRSGLIEFKNRHESIVAMLPPPVGVDGSALDLVLSSEQKLGLLPHVIPASTLIMSLREMSIRNIAMLKTLASKFQPTMQRHFPNLHIPQIEVEDVVNDAHAVKTIPSQPPEGPKMNKRRGWKRVAIVLAFFWVVGWALVARQGNIEVNISEEHLAEIRASRTQDHGNWDIISDGSDYWINLGREGSRKVGNAVVYGIGIPFGLLILLPFVWFIYRGFKPKVVAE